ncbi:TrkH family potassium uptake protein [Staphylococcus gallinarum]|uniref:TrkH family potassium uptake protein n=1 Tax=Staphylococcus gallinarum TaxID=1293 RepID=UPI001E3F4981|nr:TrkH family potassium uptake protein [Staphylococcus gallinarum]MCD8785643.1 TrkH family potassium uptake protein [Staphylococcus gallinarum]MCD8858354.1 TrkH family potassium uptake protein [Staphylococcus gallinarum]
MKNVTQLTYLYLSLFLTTTVIGSLLLYLPVTGKKPISLIDAFFVASSAFTVTGLSTVDVPKQFNALGETIIMLLIQIGGIGIVTLSIFVLILSRKKITYNERSLLMITWNSDKNASLLKLTIQMIAFAFGVEFLGFLMLNLVFIPDYGLARGSFISLFTSVSAFNNAGFSLFSDNLMSYSGNPMINIIVPALIIFGGIGYIVILDVVKTRKITKLKLHTKIVLVSTFTLIVGGTIAFWLLEYHHVLKGSSVHEQLFKSFFQSVSTRTAGFNSVDMSKITNPTILVFIVLMFIGAAPMSSAGGIKVTTFTVILVYIYSRMMGIEHPQIFKRSLLKHQVNNAILIFVLGMFSIGIATFIITIAEPHIPFIKLLFEVVSAFGTVGLSTGITADLSTISKIVIICIMILGKVGLFILLSIFQAPKVESLYYYAKEEIQM